MSNTNTVFSFLDNVPKPAEVKSQMADCHTSIKSHYDAIKSERSKLKQLRRVLAISESIAGKAPVNRTRKPKAAPVEVTPTVAWDAIDE